MIRSDSVNGPFSRSRCPFDDEGEQCKRPFCPFFHPFTGASKMLIKVKEEVQDDDIIVVLEKVGPPRSSLTSQVESPPIAPNTVMTQQSQYDPIPNQYACGYLGYLAPNISADEHVNPPIHEHILSSHKLTQVNEQSTSGLPRVLNNSSKAKDIGSGSISLSHHKKQKEKLASAPSYTPTPIVQLEREEEERKKRRELAERQKNIRNRLKRQDLAKSKQNNNKNIVDKNVIDPIDQIMVTQEILLKDQREQKLEELAKIEVEKKRHKERMEKQDEMKKNKKGIKLKSGETCSGLILAGAPRNIMKISNCKQQDLKRSDELNCKSNDDVWLSKKSSSDIMEEYEKKVEDWKEKINKPIEKAAKERTVIDDILTTKRQQHSTSSFNNDFGNASKKLCFYNILDQKKKKSRLNEKCEFGINENVKMLSNIDKSIGILEEEIRQSNNKSNKSSQPSASVSNELKLNLKNYIDEKKKVPIWRKKSNAPTDIILENKLNNVRKSSDDIINSLFKGDEVESSTKKDNNKKKHFYESINLVHKRQRTSSNNERNKKQKLENEEDSEILKEKQALVDLLSDNVLTPTMSLSSTSSVSVVPATPSPVASPTQKPKSPIQLNVKNSSNNTFHSEIPSTISTNLNCSINNNNFSDIKHTLPSTLKKSEQRKAHLNISSKGDQQKLFPLDPNNKKVSIQIRQTKLRIIYEEYIKICANDPKLAIESAQREEKEVLDRCSTKNGYISAIPNLIKRLRNFATNNSIPKSSSD